MSSGVLSQEEIDALLKGEATVPPQSPEPLVSEPGTIVQPETLILSDMEKDTIGEIANMSMGSAATALSTLLGRKVEITTPQVHLTDLDQLQAKYPRPYVVVNVEYIAGINGSNLLIIKESDASIIVDLMMGGDGTNISVQMEEIQMSAVAEAMNQMMGSAATAMSTILSKRVDISPPILDFKDFSKGELRDPSLENPPMFVTVSFQMTIEGLIDSEIMQLIPLDLARTMASTLLGNMSPKEQPAAQSVPSAPVQAPQVEQAPPVQQAPQVQYVQAPQAAMSQPPAYAEPPSVAYNPPAMYAPPPQPAAPAVPVQPAQFTPLRSAPTPLEGTNIDILMDVPLQITVELGRAKKTIREILSMAPGSVIELDKIAGEPVDLMVNGKLLAKGEVVVIDENFGIRVTDIISPLERVANLQ